MLVVMLAAVGVVYGGGRWSGIDPIVDVNGHRINVEIDVPPDQWCNIDGDILVTINVPDLDNATFISESVGDEQFCNVMTSTTLKENSKLDSQFDVKTKVYNIDGTEFDVDVVVGVDGAEVGVFPGFANGKYIKSGTLDLTQ